MFLDKEQAAVVAETGELSSNRALDFSLGPSLLMSQVLASEQQNVGACSVS